MIVTERTIALIYSIFQQLYQPFASTRAGTWQHGIDFDRFYHTFKLSESSCYARRLTV